MTDVVEISEGNASDALQLAQSIAKGGATGGYVVDAASVELSTRNSGLSTADGEFAEVSASGSTITLADGEAYIGGTWLARDTQSTVTVPSGFTGTLTVYIGYDADSADTVVVDHDETGSAFSTYDPKVAAYTYSCTSGSVDGAGTDVRTLGQVIKQDNFEATAAGSIFDAFAMDGAKDLADGSGIGDKAGEIFRYITAGGDDRGYGLVEVDGKFHLTYNAYWDSAGSVWKRGKTGWAAKLSFGDGGTAQASIEVAPSGTGNIASWVAFVVGTDGSLDMNGTTVFDGSEVPQSVLGGAASSLGTYPIPASDINDGPGSGLDADTVDGEEAASIAGDWVEITAQTFDDGISWDSGVLGTTYDRYRLTIYREYEPDDSEEDYLGLRLNNNGTTGYQYDYFDAANNTFLSDTSTSFNKVGGIRSLHGGYAMQELEIACPTTRLGTVNRPWPILSTPVPGVGKNVDYIVSGSFRVDTTEVNRFELLGDAYATDGKIRLRGRNIF